MGKIPKPKIELVDEGTYKAVCVGVIELGTQVVNYKGKEKKSHKILVEWELLKEYKENGEVFVISKQYTFSASTQAILMQDLKAWLGVKDGDFDMEDCLGEPALITVEHSEDGRYANVVAVTKPVKGEGKFSQPETEMRSLFFEDWDEETFDSLSNYLKEKIMSSDEYDEIASPQDEDEEEEEEDEAPVRRPAKKAAKPAPAKRKPAKKAPAKKKR